VSRSGWFRRQQPLLATSETSSSPAPGKKKRAAGLTACGAALVFGAGIMIVAFAAPGSHASAVASVNRATTSNRVTPARSQRPAAALQLDSITPAGGARGVNGTRPIRVQFSAPIAASSPMPALSPRIAGRWTVQGDAAVFTPAVGYVEDTRVTVTIPSGSSGVKSAAGVSAGAGGTLRSAAGKSSFTTGSFGHLGLQQLLAQLGYLPMTWTATNPTTPAAARLGSAKAALAAAYSPPAGTFSWQGSYPWNLTSQWKPGSGNILEQGAVRAFESVHGLTMDGTAGPSVWSSLLTAAAKKQVNPNGYTYGLASQNYPENLKIWHDGRLVFTSASNTGIPASPTADGTFPVYLRYYYQIMKGTNPDGSKYADPVYYVAYFNGGDAVHYFPRYSYGFYQSLGCVELPWDSAMKAWPYLTYGSLVTVTGPVA
jgi:peptidoglycan hydrolase-like protein with peptidoglycan-binding domain